MVGCAIAQPGRVRIVFGAREADIPASNRRVREASTGNRGVVAEGAVNFAQGLGSFLIVRVRKAFARNRRVVAKRAENGAVPLLRACAGVALVAISRGWSEFTTNTAQWWPSFFTSWDRLASAWWYKFCIGRTRNGTDEFVDFFVGREQFRSTQAGGSKDGAPKAGCHQ